jgi:hypothetical protein
MSAACEIPTGSRNRPAKGSISLPQLLSQTVCAAAGSPNRQRRDPVAQAIKKVPWMEEALGTAEMLL